MSASPATGDGLGLPGRRWSVTALVFNSHPACYLHPSWHARLPHGDCVARLRHDSRAAPWVSRYLLQNFALEHHFCTDFRNRWTRLALLDGVVLESLFLYLGLALGGRDMRDELSGSQIRHWKATLGTDALDFVHRRVALLGQIPAFSYEPPVTEPRQRLLLIGRAFCADGLQPFGPGLLKRLALKLPADWPDWSDTERIQADHAMTELPTLVYRLLRDLAPRWIPLFA